MNKSISILCLNLLICSIGMAFLSPIEHPKITIDQACEKALNYHKKKYTDADSHFVVKAQYGVLEDSLGTEGNVHRYPERLKEIRKKTGWLIHILRSNDLSQSDFYFIDQESNIKGIRSTI
ncbi:MAG: hypothetical protein ACSHX8_16065 [Opitutaceae bacterium]